MSGTGCIRFSRLRLELDIRHAWLGIDVYRAHRRHRSGGWFLHEVHLAWWKPLGHLVFDGSIGNRLPGLCYCDRDLGGAGAHFVDPGQHFFEALSIIKHDDEAG